MIVEPTPAERALPRWRVLVNARVEVIVPAETGVGAELALIDELRAGGTLAPPDWTEAYVVPGSATLVEGEWDRLSEDPR